MGRVPVGRGRQASGFIVLDEGLEICGDRERVEAIVKANGEADCRGEQARGCSAGAIGSGCDIRYAAVKLILSDSVTYCTACMYIEHTP